METQVEMDLTSGETLMSYHDLSADLPIDQIESGLRRKSSTLLGSQKAERLWSLILSDDNHSVRDLREILKD
jgi:hypothetical protein